MIGRRKGQIAIEWGVLVVAVAATCAAMAILAKRLIAGRAMESLNEISDRSYEPRRTTSYWYTYFNRDETTSSELKRSEPVAPGVIADVMLNTTKINSDSTRTGRETVGPLGSNLWEE